jgi:UDP-glucose 4-epimerase
MSKILVTGGAGFIGSALISELQRFDHTMYVIDDLSFGDRSFVDVPNTHFFKEDICDKDVLKDVLGETQPDWIIHLAAIHFIPYCNEHPYEAANVNIRGTINLVEAAETVAPEKFFFASTAAVYPIYDGPLKETHPLDPMDIYGLSKLAGEHIAREFFLKTQIPTVICRFFNAFGPNETNDHLIPEIQRQINAGQRTIQLGNLDPKRDFIHTSDMATAVRLLMESFDDGVEVFNLGRGIEYSVREVVEAFERQVGERIQIEQDPDRIREVDRMHLLADITKLKNFIDWEPKVTLDEGIRTLLD